MYHGFAKFIRGRAFSFLFLFVSICFTGYLSFRLGNLIEYFTSFPAHILILLVSCVLFGYMLFYANSRKAEKHTYKLYGACSVALCFALNIALCFLLFDCIKIFVPFENVGLYAIPAIASVFLSLYGFIHAKHITLKTYHVPLGNHNKNVRLALISDIHFGTFVDKKQLHKIIDTVNASNCDYVIIAGDIFDVDAFWHCNLEELSAELKTLKPAKKTYASLGNHDPKSTNPKLLAFFQAAQIDLLVDQADETPDFTIIGRDDITTNPERKALSSILCGNHPGKPTIVIDHNPAGIDEGVQNKVDLILCGHTHKGQFFPATLFTKWSYGNRGFYGCCKTGCTTSVVSSGAGFFQMPMRTGSNSEVVVIDLAM